MLALQHSCTTITECNNIKQFTSSVVNASIAIREEDAMRLSQLIYPHINMMGRYPFYLPEIVARGKLRPLRNPADDE